MSNFSNWQFKIFNSYKKSDKIYIYKLYFENFDTYKIFQKEKSYINLLKQFTTRKNSIFKY